MLSWINFFLMEQKSKTQVWRVETKKDQEILGMIRWLPNWKKYSFLPTANIVYNAIALKDIAKFLNVLMNKKKK